MKPVWNPIRRELAYNGAVIKRFPQRSYNQVAVLEVFQLERWPEFVFDPLPPNRNMDPHHRLRDTVNCLNNHHVTKGIIRFHTVQEGEGVRWELLK